MARNFSDIADKKLSDVERPKLVPPGDYRVQVVKIPSVETTGSGDWDIIRYPVSIIEMIDGDFDAVTEYGDLKNAFLSHSFMFDKNDDTAFEKAEWQMRRFLVDVLKCCEETDSFNVGMNASVNQQFIASVKWKQDKNDADLYHANIAKVSSLPE